MKAGYDAQLKSLVLLKNKSNVLPLKGKPKVYVPKRKSPAARDWFGNVTPEKVQDPVSIDLLNKYVTFTSDAAAAEYAIVFVNSPTGSTGYDRDDRLKGSNGYIPISLQYGPYTAASARAQSIAAGDPVLDSAVSNRSYKDKAITATNITDLQSILDTKKLMGNKPVIVVINAASPMVFSEFESQADGILLSFGVQHQAILDMLSGKTEPSGLLPVTMPASMEIVEKQFEDVPHDMQPHRDSQGNSYKFGYGLNWKGVITDARTTRYNMQTAKR
jgi:beta-glucosidase